MASEDDKKTSVLRQLAASDCLPSLSPLIIQLLELAADDASSAHDLARLVAQDPSLATRLIKLVNSVHYARRRTISSISQAIMVIGCNKLRVMALSISLRDAFPLGKVGNMDYEGFWKMSLYRALIAQGIAQSFPASSGVNEDEAFTAALILEMGLLMLYRLCPAPLKESFPGVDAPMDDILAWEENNFAINHREVGRIIFSRWHFPPQIIETQKYAGTDALTESQPALRRIVEFARICAQVLLSHEGQFELIDQVAADLGMDGETVNEILCETFAKVEMTADHLRLKVDCNRDILEVMEKANRALAKLNGSLEVSLGKVLDYIADQEVPDAKTAEELAQERQKTIKDVLDTVAHEIRNPLMAIGGFAQRMAQVVEDDTDLRKYAHIIVQESGRLEHVLNEVVAFSQDYQPSFARGNLIQTLEEAIQEIRSLLERNDIQLVRKYGGAPLIVKMDSSAIKKAIQQLLEALVQLVKKEDPRIWIEIPPAGLADQIKISIGGKGEALPNEVKKMLSGFDFSTKSFGLGYSLLLAWKTLEAHHGRMEIISDDHVNQFVISLPLERRLS